MSNLTFWHNGKHYDFADAGDRTRALEAIDYNSERGAINDQTMLAFSLMGIIAILTDDPRWPRVDRG